MSWGVIFSEKNSSLKCLVTEVQPHDFFGKDLNVCS